MARLKLNFKSISEIVGTDDIGLLILTNTDETRQLAVPCDKHMLDEFRLRMKSSEVTQKMLPEVLWRVLHWQSEMQQEVYIDAIIEGQYQAVLMDPETFHEEAIRASDAILFSFVSGGSIPIYIDSQLFARQSTPYDHNSAGISLPVNAISDDMLQAALDKAVSSENYEVAGYLRDEIIRRKQKNKKNSETEETS